MALDLRRLLGLLQGGDVHGSNTQHGTAPQQAQHPSMVGIQGNGDSQPLQVEQPAHQLQGGPHQGQGSFQAGLFGHLQPQPFQAKGAQGRNGAIPLQPQFRQLAGILKSPLHPNGSSPHSMGSYDLQRPLGLGSYQQEGEFQTPVQDVSPMVAHPPVQGSGRQVQFSWDNPEDIYRFN